MQPKSYNIKSLNHKIRVMKKTYIIPQMSIMKVMQESPLAESGVLGSNGIDYGGIDINGDIEPSAKENFFDFEWE